jgi:predicted Ser/Thr protein kinase
VKDDDDSKEIDHSDINELSRILIDLYRSIDFKIASIKTSPNANAENNWLLKTALKVTSSIKKKVKH